MKLKDVFDKQIDRAIEGVIKADDTASLKIEVEEYVITKEVAQRLGEFFSAYNDYRGANGVWISGFFGSGKSHLLKMLALLLENAEVVDGQTVLDFFLPKCSDALLKADMKRAAEIPSKSILFNIDQKADTISKTEVDAVLAVFVKVFNEMCGYYGKQGYVAQMERDLDNRGLYGEFKKAYEQLSGKKWEKGREEIILEKGNIAKAYSQVSGTPEEVNKNIVDAYRNDYKLSIEDFADQVNDYIKKQKPNFRLNFFVDEVGQYIADNVKLMTNLQTIAESLATRCKGRAWLIVTAQADMDAVLGDMGKQMTNDFARIQDRFKIRLKLTSQNVDEVIQKRLLKKNEKGSAFAEKLYEKDKNNFGTLFDFTDGATTYKNFTSKQHFVDCYPFPQYQFTLFQKSIETLSSQSAFEGKHSSVGERSMLGVFQHVAKIIGDKEVGQLATFDLMFSGIETTLKPFITNSLFKAENNLNNPFAIRVLKIMLLVKYIKGFNITPRNLRVLLLDTFDQNAPKLLKQIEDALSLLEQQTYIQRNGDVYEYLTDEEQDVERAIKNTEVDSAEIAKTLEEILFSGIIKDAKMRYDVTGRDYPFTKKLDDKITNREQELTIHFITPFSEYVDDLTALKSHSLGRPELLVVLPNDLRFYTDLTLFKKTEKYIRNSPTRQNESILNIIGSKGRQNEERQRLVLERARELVGKAKFFVAGEAVEIAGEDPKTRIVKGFNELVMRTYPNLSMLKNVKYDESDIKKYLDIMKDSLRLTDQLTEPEQDMLGFIRSNKNIGTRVTLKSLEERYTRKPYGWYLDAIQCVAAMLLGREQIEARVDSNILEGAELEQALKNTYGFGNIILDLGINPDPEAVRKIRKFYSDFFDEPASANEAKALGVEVRAAFQELFDNLRILHAQVHEYPFLVALAQPINAIQELTGKDYAYYFAELPKRENELLDMKEDVISPIRAFMSTNKNIFDESNKFLQTQSPNFSAMENDKPAQLKALLDASDCYKGNRMKEAKTLMDGLKKDVEKHVKQVKADALAQVEKLQQRVKDMQEYSVLKKEDKQDIEQSFTAIQNYIQNENLISSIRDRAARYQASDYNALLTRVTELTKPDTEKKTVEYVSQGDLGVNIGKNYLADETDVDEYLNAVKKAMLKAIKNNKRIQL